MHGQDLKLPPDLVKLVFGTDAGNLASVTPLSDGSYAVAEVSGRHRPPWKPPDQVARSGEGRLTAEQQQNAAEAKAKDIATRLKAGGDLAAEAKMLGLEMKHDCLHPRGRLAADGIDPAFAADLFKAKLAGIDHRPAQCRGAGRRTSFRYHAGRSRCPMPMTQNNCVRPLAQQIRTDLAGSVLSGPAAGDQRSRCMRTSSSP